MDGPTRTGLGSNRTARQLGGAAGGDGGGGVGSLISTDGSVLITPPGGVGDPVDLSVLASLANLTPVVLRSPTLVTWNPNTLGAGGTNQQAFSWGPSWPNLPGKQFSAVAAKVQVNFVGGGHVANPSCQIGDNPGGLNNVVSGGGIAATTLNSIATTPAGGKNAYLTFGAGQGVGPAGLLLGAPPTIFVQIQATPGALFSGYVHLIGYFTNLIP